jgi:hypothetical protein
MKDDLEILINDPAPHVAVLLQEYKQAGVLPNGWYDIAVNQETRRMIWAGQAPDGRKWDENMPEGQVVRPWNGSSDARVPLVDSVCNDDTAVNSVAFQKAELRATATDPAQLDAVGSVSAYLHWMVHTKYRRDLRMEVELSTQYSREHGWCVAYVGWERELGKRKMTVTVEELRAFAKMMAGGPGGDGTEQMAQGMMADPGEMLMAAIMDPEQEEAAMELLRTIYRDYVQSNLAARGFYAEELESEKVLDLKASAARRAVRELRETGQTEVPLAYVVKNQPLCWVLMPYMEFLAARGTMRLQQARAVFWRRWMTEAELESKQAEGWDTDWIEAVKKTKGNISSWAGAMGATSLTGPSTKTVGNTTYLKITEENNPLIEVVYAFVKKVDEDGITGVYETIFSPHVTANPETSAVDFCARHELLDYAHGRYPFVEYKREHIGRALTDTRSVAEVANTWQGESKCQRDMLFNRAQWDTLPPVKVPTLGGVDYKLGPGAQVPMKRNDSIEALNLGAPPASLALELVKMIELQTDKYFGQFNPELHPALVGVKQEKAVSDFYAFWGEVLMQMFALTLQYNPQEIVKVTGDERLAGLDPFGVFEQFQFGLEFDVQELNPDYLQKKIETIITHALPTDAAGVIDRASLTNLLLRMLDPRLAQQVLMNKGEASQKIFREVDTQIARMALGNEAEYTENDATAPMKMQFLQQIVGNNPKYQEWLKSDQRFQELFQNYAKNLQMSVAQEQNKQVGRLGVKQVGAEPVGAMT